MKKIQLLALASLVLGAVSCGGAKVEETKSEVVKETSKETVNVNENSIAIDIEKSIINWKGEKLTEAHNGTLALSSGSFIIEEGVLKGGKFTVDMKSMKNLDLPEGKKAQLIDHLSKKDFFLVDSFPNAELIIRTVKSDSIIADLTIKGITEKVAFPYAFSSVEGVYSANANLVFDRTKFGVEYKSGNIFTDLAKNKIIKDEITLDISLVSKK